MFAIMIFSGMAALIRFRVKEPNAVPCLFLNLFYYIVKLVIVSMPWIYI